MIELSQWKRGHAKKKLCLSKPFVNEAVQQKVWKVEKMDAVWVIERFFFDAFCGYCSLIADV